MKKHISFVLALFILIINLSPAVFAAESNLKIPGEIKSMQTRVYNTNDPQVVSDCVLKLLNSQNYKIVYKNNDLMYLNASKHSTVKDISKLLLTGYFIRIGWDVFKAVLTSGLTSYSIVGDVLLIKTEFKDKDLQQNIGINISNKENKTEVRVNISDLLVGKRDGLFIGKKNRLKTVQVRDEETYNLFFSKLDKELKAENINL